MSIAATPVFPPRRNVVTEQLAMTPVTVVPWPGAASQPGAFLISRVNLEFLSHTCNKLSSDLDVATRVASVLASNGLNGSTNNIIKRYGYVFLTLESGYRNTLDYITKLLLCSGRGGELWGKYSKFNSELSRVWELLKSNPHQMPHYSPFRRHNNQSIKVDPFSSFNDVNHATRSESNSKFISHPTESRTFMI